MNGMVFRAAAVCSLAFWCSGQVSAAEKPEAPEPRSRSEIEAVLAKAAGTRPSGEIRHLNIVLVADEKDHGENEHDYPLWQERWKTLLAGGQGPVNLYGPADSNSKDVRGGENVTVTTAKGWPNKEQLASADVIVAFCYIKWDDEKLSQLAEYLKRGGGFVPVHSATWTRPAPSERLAKLTGCGGFTLYRHGPLKLTFTGENDPICLGLPETIEFFDESYWPLTPDANDKQMKVLAVSEERISRTSGEKRPQPMFWTYRYGQGRIFGCVPGHYMWTFDDPYFRLLLLRGMAWSAGEWPCRFDSLATRGVKLAE